MRRWMYIGAVVFTGCVGSGRSFLRTSPAVVVSVQGDAIVVGSKTLQTAAMISDARGVMGAVVGFGFDPLISDVSAQRPEDLPATCLWEKNEGHGTVCIAIACQSPISAGAVAVPRSLASFRVRGRQEGTTAILVRPGSCQEDTCVLGTEDDEGRECLGIAGGPISVTAAPPCVGDCSEDRTVAMRNGEFSMGPCAATDSSGECIMSMGLSTSGPFSQESMR